MQPHARLYTVGHSNHPLERFLGLLRAQRIGVLADVRSHPASRFNPQYNRAALAAALAAEGIGYLFLGRELGARPSDPACFDAGRVSYAKIARTQAFGEGLECVRAAMAGARVALMCAEKDPLDCHRTILVARALAEAGVPVAHLLADGALETHQAATERLLAELGLPLADLHREALVAEAFRLKGERMTAGARRARR